MTKQESNKEFMAIDEEINNAITTVTELEGWVKELTNENGIVKIEQGSPIKDKFGQLHKEVQSLTKALVELGLLDEQDV